MPGHLIRRLNQISTALFVDRMAEAGLALPPVPFEQLFQLTALFSGLYMGGHTAKDVAGKVAGIFAAKRGGM